MPAILRNSLPNNYALISIIRPYAVYDRVGVGRAGSRVPIHRVTRCSRHVGLQHYALRSVWVLSAPFA